MLLNEKTCCDHRQRNCCMEQISIVRRGHAAIAAKTLVPESRQVRCDAGVSPGGIACGNRRAFRNAQMSSLTWMYRASVIPTGCGCGPRVNVLAVDSDGHRVLRIDRLDVLPTDEMVGDRVSYFDTLIKHTDSRADEQQVDAVANAGAKHDVGSNTLNACTDAVCPNLTTDQQPSKAGVGKTASRSENVWLVHRNIIAHCEGARRND